MISPRSRDPEDPVFAVQSKVKMNPFAPLYFFFAEVCDLTRFIGNAVACVFMPPYRKSIARRQMDEIGVGSLPIVTLTGLFMGLVLALQSNGELRNFGGTLVNRPPHGAPGNPEIGPGVSFLLGGGTGRFRDCRRT